MAKDLTEVKDLSTIVNELDTKTNSQIATELELLAAEEKRLDLEIKREQVASIRAKRNTQLERARSAQIAIKQYMAQRNAQQNSCSHRKGGTGAEAFLRGQGDSPYYAVIKHRLPHGMYMVLCQRCGKEWHPPVPKLGLEGTPGYEQAITFNTNNSASSSATFLFEKSA